MFGDAGLARVDPTLGAPGESQRDDVVELAVRPRRTHATPERGRRGVGGQPLYHRPLCLTGGHRLVSAVVEIRGALSEVRWA